MSSVLPRATTGVLDIGCGDGILTAELINAGVAHVVGLDIDGDTTPPAAL